ncbi:MAG: hypothetical protein NTX45_13815 [Proteobacteria bacterium]|nr:hypothetical protein [Pseudomonadota bacterium]
MENISKILDIIKSLRNNNKHVIVIAIGLSAAIIMAIFLIGQNNVNVFFNQFSTKIETSNALKITLFLSNCVLAALYIISGLLELSESKSKFEAYIPPPPEGAWLLNIILCIIMALQIYTAITNILLYCILYAVLIFIDVYFRYSIANSVNVAIQTALNDLSLSRSNRKTKNIAEEIKYKMIFELYIYYKRYPILSISVVRILLTICSLVLVVFGNLTGKISLTDFAYVNMIYCIVINEIFSWGYRLKMIIALKSLDSLGA